MNKPRPQSLLSRTSQKELTASAQPPNRGIDFLRALGEQDVGRRNAAGCSIFVDVCTIDTSTNPLCRAISLGGVRLVRTLLEGGFDVVSVNLDKQTPLHVFCATRTGLADEDGQILSLLLKYTPRQAINARDRYGKTALMYAVALKRTHTIVSALLRAGADLFVQDNLGFTTLIYAFNCNDEAVIRCLVDACRTHGRQVVTMETALSANFLSYLKIQKLIGAEHGTVPLGGQSPNAAADMLPASTPDPRQQTNRRRSMGFARFGSLLRVTNPSTTSATPSSSLNPLGALRRRRSSMINVYTPSLSDELREDVNDAPSVVVQKDDSMLLRPQLPPGVAAGRRHSFQNALSIVEDNETNEDNPVEHQAPNKSNCSNETQQNTNQVNDDQQCNETSIAQTQRPLFTVQDMG